MIWLLILAVAVLVLFIAAGLDDAQSVSGRKHCASGCSRCQRDRAALQRPATPRPRVFIPRQMRKELSR